MTGKQTACSERGDTVDKAMTYDYIIVGAGPAGCFCATELVRKGRSVCLLEKEEPGFRKVCGDGVSMTCVEVLKRMEFPMEYLAEAGAVPIHTYFSYVDGRLREKAVDLEAYCLSRDRTDTMFRRYAREKFGVSIAFGEPVKEIRTVPEGYSVNGRQGRRVILSFGADGGILLDGARLLSPQRERPVGASLIVEGAAVRDDFFLFDYKPEYDGTYAWIFSLGGGLYNVGLWRNSRKELLRPQTEAFLETRGREWLGENIRIVCPLRGKIMGIGCRRELSRKDIFLVGDAANTANPADGEGISRAILDAKRLIDRLESPGRDIS